MGLSVVGAEPALGWQGIVVDDYGMTGGEGSQFVDRYESLSFPQIVETSTMRR